jgi:hypothetical protein
MILPPKRHAKSRSPVRLSALNTMGSTTRKDKEDDPMIHRFVNRLPSEVTVQPFGNEASNVRFIKESRCLWKICNVGNFMLSPYNYTKKLHIYIYIYIYIYTSYVLASSLGETKPGTFENIAEMLTALPTVNLTFQSTPRQHK